MAALAAAACALQLAAAAPAFAAPPLGDLNGDGVVSLPDLGLLLGLFGNVVGDPDYDPAADLDGSGDIDLPDLPVLYGAFLSAGDPDTDAPGLVVSLADIPDDMNDLLVAPPDRFQITLRFDSLGGSLIDPSSLVVTSRLDIGPYPAGTDLASQFQVGRTRAVWEVPAGSDLERTSHYLTVSVRDLAGNEAVEVYGFAVRDFPAGPPLGNLQTVFLDFDQDRSLGPDVDFLEDLRTYGLSSAAAPALEARARDRIVADVMSHVSDAYGLDGPDPVHIMFFSTQPAGPHGRLCIGGESARGPAYLGASTLDPNNLDELPDECGAGNLFGVFPQAIDDLWGDSAGYQAAFGPLHPGAGGVPFGEHPLDPIISAPGWNPAMASQQERDRAADVDDAFDAFARILGNVIAHEVGHTLGLTAPGPAPAGLFGGSAGATRDHNAASGGGTPRQNFLMNPGGSFSWDEITGRNGVPPPVFRPISWAYLHDRIALDGEVTELLPPTVLSSASPDPVIFAAGSPVNLPVTFSGRNFAEPAIVELVREGDPTPKPVLDVVVLDARTVTGHVNRLFVPAAVYDVRIINGDGQEDTLVDGLEVIHP